MSSIEDQADLIDEQIFTDQEKEQAKADVEDRDRADWNAGRLSMKYVDELDGELSKTAVRLAVGRRYSLGSESIRKREWVARLINEDVREQHELLTHRHWLTCCYAAPLEGRTKLECILDYVYQVEEYNEAYGKLPSIGQLESWVFGRGRERVSFVWQSRGWGIVEQSDKIINDPQTPPDFRALVGLCRNYQEQYLKTGVSPLITRPSDG